MIPGIKDVGRVLPVTVENPNDRGPLEPDPWESRLWIQGLELLQMQ